MKSESLIIYIDAMCYIGSINIIVYYLKSKILFIIISYYHHECDNFVSQTCIMHAFSKKIDTRIDEMF